MRTNHLHAISALNSAVLAFNYYLPSFYFASLQRHLEAMDPVDVTREHFITVMEAIRLCHLPTNQPIVTPPPLDPAEIRAHRVQEQE